MNISATDILNFWYSEEMKTKWFSSTPELDRTILEKYYDVWVSASSGKLDDWKDNAEGCLALVIILDQFPLNMFRGKPESFETEQKAVGIAKYAIKNKLDKNIDKEQLAFLYMPLMHSENIMDQYLSVKMFKENEMENNFRFAIHHRDIIKRFGRFPHRNEILGRESTENELKYLASKSAFKG